MPTRRGISRRHVIAGFFLFVGLLIIIAYAGQFGGADPSVTRLSFGTVPNAETGRPRQLILPLPTAPAMLLIGLVYIVAGALGFFERMVRLGIPLLWLAGGLLFPAVLIAATGDKQTNVQTMVAESLRLGTPLVLGALSGIFAERSGVVNIAIEGMMLMGAGFGFAAFVLTGNIWFGVVGAVALGGVMALLHGLLSITYKTDQIISGTVINIMALGITGYLRRGYLDTVEGGRPTLPSLEIPLLADIPFIGQILFNNKPIFYLMILLVVGAHLVIFYTPWGLRLRAVGENPRAADTVGVNVYRTRYLNLLISGMIAGLGGAWFSLETVGDFKDNMTSGKGFIALAAMIFGNWMPFGALGGAVLFGFAEALGIRFQILNLAVPVQFLQILPYVTTMVVLAGLIGRANPPAASGKPYEK